VVSGVGVWVARGNVESRLDAECGPDHTLCPPSATDDIANGKTYTALGIGLFAAGGVCLATGVISLLNNAHAASTGARVVPSVEPHAAGLRLIGDF
jgi:hypothetical protein